MTLYPTLPMHCEVICINHREDIAIAIESFLDSVLMWFKVYCTLSIDDSLVCFDKIVVFTLLISTLCCLATQFIYHLGYSLQLSSVYCTLMFLFGNRLEVTTEQLYYQYVLSKLLSTHVYYACINGE